MFPVLVLHSTMQWSDLFRDQLCLLAVRTLNFHVKTQYFYQKHLSNAALIRMSAQCQYEFKSLSGSVTEILTACRMHQILIAWCQIEAEIRGFPTMYTMEGG